MANFLKQFWLKILEREPCVGLTDISHGAGLPILGVLCFYVERIKYFMAVGCLPNMELGHWPYSQFHLFCPLTNEHEIAR